MRVHACGMQTCSSEASVTLQQVGACACIHAASKRADQKLRSPCASRTCVRECGMGRKGMEGARERGSRVAEREVTFSLLANLKRIIAIRPSFSSSRR
jgi:hypothetical protein